jgi:AcrR family transcriptional regulator
VERVRRRTQAERRAVATQGMIDAAITVIGQKGYSGSTLAEIGQVAGYSRGLAHHYFGSKMELMRAVAAELDRRFARSVLHPPPAGLPGLDAVVRYIEDYFAHVAESGPERMRTILILLFESLAVAPELRPVVAGMSAASRSHLSERIAQGRVDGTIRPALDPDVQAMLIAGLLRNAVHEWILDPARIDLAAALRETLAMVRRHLAAGPGRKLPDTASDDMLGLDKPSPPTPSPDSG